ncbi:MAG: DUF58 domain-containing protein [Nocardioidaceae bacterium]|nr:DUF58 domain-containing protein [Nocardioidaceae bacterium]
MLTALTVVALVVTPGPVPAVGATAMLLLIALVLGDHRPDELELTVVASADRCTAGDVVRYRATLAAPGTQAHLRAEIDPAQFVELAGAQPWRLSVGSETVFDLRATAWRVGSPGVFQAQVATRYGGWSAAVSVALPYLIVHPQPEEQPTAYAPPQLLSQLGGHVGRARGIGTEFAELREYAAGDPLRDVNWRASARTGEIMVSQRYRDQAADVVILVDHLGERGAYDRRFADAAVRGGASVALAYLAAGDRVGLVLYGSVLRWIAPGQGLAQRMRLLDQLVEPPTVDSFLDPVLTRIPAVALPPRAVVFCFSPLLDPRMLSALARLTQRGHRLVVIDLAGLEPQRWPPKLSSLTPQVWRRHGELVRSRLAESGAMVVDDVTAIPTAVRAMARRGVA